MIEFGKYNKLIVVKILEHGAYLDGGEQGEILMPHKYVEEHVSVGDEVEVFVYKDTDDRPIATKEKPFAQVGDFACLEVVDTNKYGAFLDWGLIKDLFVPFREQKLKMEVGNRYIVHIYIDTETERIVGSAKIEKFLDNVPPTYAIDEKVDILVYGYTDLGYNCIINNLHRGIIYQNEIFDDLHFGQETTAYIKKIREDDKIDLYFHKKGLEGSQDVADIILDKLKNNSGILHLGDKSPSEQIYMEFGISKKQFKKAAGHLYKKGLIKIYPEKIELI